MSDTVKIDDCQNLVQACDFWRDMAHYWESEARGGLVVGWDDMSEYVLVNRDIVSKAFRKWFVDLDLLNAGRYADYFFDLVESVVENG